MRSICCVLLPTNSKHLFTARSRRLPWGSALAHSSFSKHLYSECLPPALQHTPAHDQLHAHNGSRHHKTCDRAAFERIYDVFDAVHLESIRRRHCCDHLGLRGVARGRRALLRRPPVQPSRARIHQDMERTQGMSGHAICKSKRATTRRVLSHCVQGPVVLSDWQRGRGQVVAHKANRRGTSRAVRFARVN